jgi:hypothetical protein
LALRRNDCLQAGSHWLQPFILYGSESHRVFKECCFASGRISGLALRAMCKSVSAETLRKEKSKLLLSSPPYIRLPKKSVAGVRDVWPGASHLASDSLVFLLCKMTSYILMAYVRYHCKTLL